MLTTQEPLLHVDNVSHIYRNEHRSYPALASVSFDMDTGEFICIVGVSGSGKTTLLHIVGGLLPPTAGSVSLGGERIERPHPAIGFVFQKSNLMPWRTALENVLLPLELRQRIGPEERRQGHAILDLVGLAEFAHAYPAQLSGGMAQRLALARALIQQPQLLLLDEPFGALDALTRERLNLELLHIHQHYRCTVLMVTHSINEAVFLADRVLVFGGQPGSLVADITVDLPRPRSLDVMGRGHFGRLTNQVRHAIGLRTRREGVMHTQQPVETGAAL